MGIVQAVRQFLTPDAGFTLVHLDRLGPEEVAQVVASRRRQNSTTLPVMAAVTAVLVGLQFFFTALDPAITAHPALLAAYMVTFGTAFVFSAGWYLYWLRWPGAGGQGTWVLVTMVFAVALTLCDLQLSGDFSSFVLLLIGVAVLYSAPLWWYGLVFSSAWGILVTGIVLFPPPGVGTNPVTSSLVPVVVAIAAAVILEVRRIRTELLSLELHRRTQVWKEASLRDPLTGLYNRRFLFEWFNKTVSQTRRTGRNVAVALLDLDHFKLVNDTAGHGVGDGALVQAAAWLKASVRESDLVARYGGEEFVVVLPETDLETAKTVLERCLGTFRSGAIEGWDRPLTFSAGLVAVGPDETDKEVFHRVDALLYRAKDRGRNRVETVL